MYLSVNINKNLILCRKVNTENVPSNFWKIKIENLFQSVVLFFLTVVSSNSKIFIDQLRKSIISSSDGLMFFILASLPETPSASNAT